jgi:hypothetical protein
MARPEDGEDNIQRPARHLGPHREFPRFVAKGGSDVWWKMAWEEGAKRADE